MFCYRPGCHLPAGFVWDWGSDMKYLRATLSVLTSLTMLTASSVILADDRSGSVIETLGESHTRLGSSMVMKVDQKGHSLDSLFYDLKNCLTVRQARKIERKIWLIWLSHKKLEINRLMGEGVHLMNRGEFQKALRMFNIIIDQAPTYAEAWNKRATLYFLQGDYIKSIQDIRSTLILEPRHFGAISGLGLILKTLGEPEKALKAFERIREIYPFSESAKIHIDQLERELQLKTL